MRRNHSARCASEAPIGALTVVLTEMIFSQLRRHQALRYRLLHRHGFVEKHIREVQGADP
jgi:hypothetical protein